MKIAISTQNKKPSVQRKNIMFRGSLVSQAKLQNVHQNVNGIQNIEKELAYSKFKTLFKL